MTLNIRSEEVHALVRKLAELKHISKTDAVKLALQNELRRQEQAVPLRERLRPIQQRVRQRPSTGRDADRAFFDQLSGDA